MQNYIETFVPFKVSTARQLTVLNQLALVHGLKGINIYGNGLSAIAELEDFTNINLTIDFPYSFHTWQTQKLLIEQYYKDYSFINYFNLGLPFELVQDLNWSKINSYFQDASHANPILNQLRWFVNCLYFDNDNDIMQLAQLAEQNNIEYLYFTCSRTKVLSPLKMIKIIDKVRTNTNLKVGLLADISKEQTLVRCVEAGFDSVAILPRNIFQIFET